MAGRFSITRLADASAAVGTAKTMLRIAVDANTPITVSSMWISNDDSTAGDKPLKVELLEETTTSAPTGTSVTPAELSGVGAVSRVTAVVNCSAEGSPTLVSLRDALCPAGGTLYLQLPYGRDDVMPISKAWRLRVTAVTATANITYGCDWDE